jgi:hypothetical protein
MSVSFMMKEVWFDLATKIGSSAKLTNELIQ